MKSLEAVPSFPFIGSTMPLCTALPYTFFLTHLSRPRLVTHKDELTFCDFRTKRCTLLSWSANLGSHGEVEVLFVS